MCRYRVYADQVETLTVRVAFLVDAKNKDAARALIDAYPRIRHALDALEHEEYTEVEDWKAIEIHEILEEERG